MLNREDNMLESIFANCWTFEDCLQRYSEGIRETVLSFLPSGHNVDVDGYLYEPLVDLCKRGGKLHRPILCLAACDAVGGDLNMAVSSAAAIELFHSGALIHDDIVDEGKTRRGGPCVHLTSGLGLALQSGDAALALVVGTVVKDQLLPLNLKVRLIAELCDMAQVTIEGQSLDVGWARDGRYDLTVEDYGQMATCKTAHYSGGTPMALGAIAGGAAEETVEMMRDCGLRMGLAFQVQDDLLNLLGSEETTGKDYRSDITEGKRTLIAVHSLQNAHTESRCRLVNILSSGTCDPSELEEAVSIFKSTGSITFAKRFAQNLANSAKRDLLSVLPESPARQVLLSMADRSVDRIA